MAEEQIEREKEGAMYARNVIITDLMKDTNPERRKGGRQWKYIWGHEQMDEGDLTE